MKSGSDKAEQLTGQHPAPLVVIVTGMSGAGRTTAIKALEDLGFETLNNFPLSLMDRLTKPVDDTARPIAIGVDTRTRVLPGLLRLAACPGAALKLIADLGQGETGRLPPRRSVSGQRPRQRQNHSGAGADRARRRTDCR